MPSLIDLRRRIQSVKNTQQITKAMKMVAAAKLRRAQQAVINSRPYATLLEEMIGSVVAREGDKEAAVSHPLLERRSGGGVLLLVLAGEKGLCGAFNSNVFKACDEFCSERGDRVELELLGRKAVEHYRRSGVKVGGRRERLLGAVEHSRAREVAAGAMQRFVDGEVDEVWVLYNQFQGVLRQRVTLARVLPILPAAAGDDRSAGYDYEQPPEQLLGALLPRKVVTQVFVAMLDSAAAEHAARMTAMDAATRNAGEVVDKLTLHLNKVRQASITTEIIEIVSGAVAQE